MSRWSLLQWPQFSENCKKKHGSEKLKIAHPVHGLEHEKWFVEDNRDLLFEISARKCFQTAHFCVSVVTGYQWFRKIVFPMPPDDLSRNLTKILDIWSLKFSKYHQHFRNFLEINDFWRIQNVRSLISQWQGVEFFEILFKIVYLYFSGKLFIFTKHIEK